MNEFLNHGKDSSFSYYVDKLLKEDINVREKFEISIPQIILDSIGRKLYLSDIINYVKSNTPDGIGVTIDKDKIVFSTFNKGFQDVLNNDYKEEEFWADLISTVEELNSNSGFITEDIYEDDDDYIYKEENWDREYEEDDILGPTNRYEFLATKQVDDSNGFKTDYTLYYDSEEDKYITIFGDNELYGPDNSVADYEVGDRKVAFEWFDNYRGFEEDLDENVESDLYIPSNYHKKPKFDSIRMNDKNIKVNREFKKPFEYDDVVEGWMSDLDIELQNGKQEAIEKIKRNIKDLEKEVYFLENQAPREIKKGGAFDNQEEIDEALELTYRELNREKAKLAIITREAN